MQSFEVKSLYYLLTIEPDDKQQAYKDAWTLRRMLRFACRRQAECKRRGQTPRDTWHLMRLQMRFCDFGVFFLLFSCGFGPVKDSNVVKLFEEIDELRAQLPSPTDRPRRKDGSFTCWDDLEKIQEDGEIETENGQIEVAALEEESMAGSESGNEIHYMMSPCVARRKVENTARGKKKGKKVDAKGGDHEKGDKVTQETKKETAKGKKTGKKVDAKGSDYEKGGDVAQETKKDTDQAKKTGKKVDAKGSDHEKGKEVEEKNSNKRRKKYQKVDLQKYVIDKSDVVEESPNPSSGSGRSQKRKELDLLQTEIREMNEKFRASDLPVLKISYSRGSML